MDVLYGITLILILTFSLTTSLFITQMYKQTPYIHSNDYVNPIMKSDRAYTIEKVFDTPQLYIIEDFLTSKECDMVLKIATEFHRSKVYGDSKDTYQSIHRTSFTCTLKKQQNDLIRRLEERVSKLVHCPTTHIEPFQIVRYENGQEFKKHYDYFGGIHKEKELQTSGQRVATLFVYLNNVEEGGCTYFNKLDYRICPKKGRAVFWLNLKPNGDLDPLTEHCGEPPKNCIKYGLNIWTRENPFQYVKHT